MHRKSQCKYDVLCFQEMGPKGRAKLFAFCSHKDEQF